MGFTVVGFDRFLASGHPDLRDRRLRVDGKPPLLGLVERGDAGATWEPRSLLGHVRTWERLSSIEITSFAIDPDDVQRAVAATGNGVVVSTDGGRSWQAVAGARGWLSSTVAV
ncbi:MAG TPA: hypothetical protein VM262_21400 [Acidimicrobiales bacterium]|nr:hypothetical protein [Acidimicrobiales bacterium]